MDALARFIQQHPIPVIIGFVASLVTIGGALLRWRSVAPAAQTSPPPADASNSITPSSSSSPPAAEQWHDCAYCDGTGQYVKFANLFRTDHATCTVCDGHGQHFSDLWSQPDCRRCNGSGKLTSTNVDAIVPITLQRRTHLIPKTTKNVDVCDVCSGIGKRPKLMASET